MELVAKPWLRGQGVGFRPCLQLRWKVPMIIAAFPHLPAGCGFCTPAILCKVEPPLRWLAQARGQGSKIDGLNEEQMRAVTSDAGCVRVTAGPGSGKTRVLTHRIAHLIRDRGVCASNILGITFTNKAAKEISERLHILLGDTGDKKPTTGTFHSVCARILRANIHLLGHGLDTNFKIFDENDTQKLLKSMCEEVQKKAKERAMKSIQQSSLSSDSLHSQDGDSISNNMEFVATFISWMSSDPGERKKKSSVVTPKRLKQLSAKVQAVRSRKLDVFIKKRRRGKSAEEKKVMDDFLFTQLANWYEHRLKSNNAVDFDDLIALTVRLLHLCPSVLEQCRNRWTHILVDEFQDTNLAQYEFVRLLCATNKNLFVVGDVDQSIYGWRGADFNNMETYLSGHFPEVVSYQLQKNYRSSANIVNLASLVMNSGRSDRRKSLQAVLPPGLPVTICRTSSGRNEANFVVGDIARYIQRDRNSWGGCAVMYRYRTQKFAVQEELLRRSIPFTVIGETFLLQRKEIKDLQAYLMLVSDANNEIALMRAINTPPRGIGEKTIDKINKWASANGLSFPKALQKLGQEHPPKEELGMTAKARIAVLSFCRLVEELRELRNRQSVSDMIDVIITRTDYVKYLKDENKEEDKFEETLANLRQFQALANDDVFHVRDDGDKQDPLSQFLQNCALALEGTDDKQKTVKLMTMHAAKGLEFDCVFLIGLEEGHFPYSNVGKDQDEERRLFYVGITRAKKHLYLTYKTQTWLSDSNETVDARPSRFVTEILQSPDISRAQIVKFLDMTAAGNMESDLKSRRRG